MAGYQGGGGRTSNWDGPHRSGDSSRRDLDDDDTYFHSSRTKSPREVSLPRDTTRASSRRHGRHSSSLTTRGVDGSNSDLSDPGGHQYHRYAARQIIREVPRSSESDVDAFQFARHEEVLPGAGAWTSDPPHGGQPELTYGHNGLYQFSHTRSDRDMIDHFPVSSWHDQQSTGSSRHVHRDSLYGLERLTPRGRSQERRTFSANDRCDRFVYHERSEYHEAHEYDERRDQDQRRRYRETYKHVERTYHDDNGRRRRRHANEPR